MFSIWNTLKQRLHKNSKRLYFKEGQVFWISLGKNIGDEEYGKGEKFLRPVLVIKKFNAQIFLGIPLSSTIKEGRYYFSIHIRKKDRKKVVNNALLSQIRVLDAKRLQNSFGTISPEELFLLKEKSKEVLLS